jgi:predicted DCC family thiol-disulfide oxidoreductase YuxK
MTQPNVDAPVPSEDRREERAASSEELTRLSDSHPIVLFDGVCNLCNSSVQFIIDRDPHAQFRFAPLQSEVGETLRAAHEIPEELDSIVLIDGGRPYWKSSAALRVARRLQGAWSLLFALIVIPAFLRDAIYGWIARNRYRWFGREDACRLPSPELEERFLQMDPIGS